MDNLIQTLEGLGLRLVPGGFTSIPGAPQGTLGAAAPGAPNPEAARKEISDRAAKLLEEKIAAGVPAAQAKAQTEAWMAEATAQFNRFAQTWADTELKQTSIAQRLQDFARGPYFIPVAIGAAVIVGLAVLAPQRKLEGCACPTTGKTEPGKTRYRRR